MTICTLICAIITSMNRCDSYINLRGLTVSVFPLEIKTNGIFWFAEFGVFPGMSHAMEADHLAAVSSLWRAHHGRRTTMQSTFYWNAGHARTLLLFCSLLLLSGSHLSAKNDALLELAAAALVIALGARLICRLHSEKIHFHVHKHDGQRHLHAYSHANQHAVGKMKPEQSSHAAIPHHHKHPKKPFGALCIGVMHGAAGTGSLMVLAVTATQSFLLSLACLAIFCASTLLGMILLTVVVSLPFTRTGIWATQFKQLVSVVIACTCFGSGGMLAYEQLLLLGVV
jgi:ABC-type nickel/cobalt efflux system permease component RcnA